MFASIEQIVRKRATSLCDIYSLICLVYFFVNDTLPWLDYIDKKAQLEPEPDSLYEEQNFSMTRMLKNKDFEKELVAKSGELSPLVQYVH